ncbi:MAG: SufE family protein [Desulfobacterales bacterium]
MSEINEIQDQIIEEFAPLNEWFDRYERLIAFGSELPRLAETERTDENLINDCQSRLWLAAHLIDGRLVFYADSEAKITRGIIALVLKVVNKQPPGAVADADLYFLDAIGLTSNLSPARANGLASILKRINQLARQHIKC